MELSKNKLNIYSSLGNRKMRKKYGLFLVEGLKAVLDTLSSFEAETFITTGDFNDNLLPEKDKIRIVSPQTMKKISNLSTSSSIIAIYKIPVLKNKEFEITDSNLYLVLDGIQDPGNLGTIIRTCHWFGIKTIFASHDTADIYNPKTIQSSMGSIGHVNLYYTDLKDLLKKHLHMPRYGLLLDGNNIFESKLTMNGFIIMGNEGKGISENVRNLVNFPLLIPPAEENHSESLNVAVATGITISLFKK